MCCSGIYPKYLYSNVTLSEVPDEISLCLSITNCKGACKGCHSPELRQNIGTILYPHELHSLLRGNKGISCVCFLGDNGKDWDSMSSLCSIVKEIGLKTCLYTGSTLQEILNSVTGQELLYYLDYLKVDPYIEEYGALDKRTTNQRLYKVSRGVNKQATDIIQIKEHYLENITYKFWNRRFEI